MVSAQVQVGQWWGIQSIGNKGLAQDIDSFGG